MCLAGAVVAALSLTQEVAGSSPFTVMINIFTARKRSLGQGKIFTPVCHSVHRGGVHGCLGGMHGCSGWHAWFFSGGCVVFFWRGHVWFLLGGMHGFFLGVHGFSRGACVVFSWGVRGFSGGGVCMVFLGGRA